MMIIAEINPLKDFKNRGELYAKGVAALVEESIAKRWERDGYAKIVQTHDVAALIAAGKTENSKPEDSKKKSNKADKGES